MSGQGLPLTLSLHEEIEARLRAVRRTYGIHVPSEYTFSNLYLFRDAHSYLYLPGRYPCVSGRTYDGTRHLLPLFDTRDVAPADLERLLGDHDCLFPIPSAALAGMDPARWCWSQSPDDADYFFPALNFREYRGDALRKKRNLMQQLLSRHRIETRPLADANVADAMCVLAGWMQDRDKSAGEADEAPCAEALQLHRTFGMDGLVYYADGIPVGFLIAQPLVPGVAAMRFAKGRDSHAGIYQYMFHHYCVSRKGCIEWLNFEQDLGHPNFRQTKRSYQPSLMLQKFRLRRLIHS